MTGPISECISRREHSESDVDEHGARDVDAVGTVCEVRQWHGLLPRLFAHSIHEFEPKLAACLEVAEWRGGDTALEVALFAAADCVTATGAMRTLLAIRNRLPAPRALSGLWASGEFWLRGEATC